MLLRSSISNTKKFFQKTLHNFKCFFSSGYHRIPKTPPTTDYSAPMDIHNYSSYKGKEVYYENPLQKMKDMAMEIKRDQDYCSSSSSSSRDICGVERKLREMKMLDMGNVEYLMDIEEVLYYYSKLTSPAYLQMVDAFFMQIYYSDFFLPI